MLTFDEPVSGFDGSDVTLSGTAGATTATVTGGPQLYSVAVTGMTQPGTVIATIAAGVASDGHGNTNTASTSDDNSVALVALAAPAGPDRYRSQEAIRPAPRSSRSRFCCLARHSS